MWRQWTRKAASLLPSSEFTSLWCIWWASNKRTHEGPIVWRSTERNWIVRRAFTEVSSYKLPGKLPDCGIREGNWRVIGFRQLGARMSVKALSAITLLDYFPKNCEDLIKEQGERFHQDIHIIEERYQSRWDIKVHTDYCWCLKRNVLAAFHPWIVCLLYSI